jgi:LAO/AO transport system kinase
MVASQETVRNILQGDIRTVSRALSDVESGRGAVVRELLKELYPHAGRALVIGVTGSPGAGKSTLVEQLARWYRKSDQRVGIVAVDPTSPFSGGAILGDRVRMQSLATDPGVFIRSMATRGKMGGLSAAVNDALLILDAAGYEILIVETVGVGQDEVDIVRTADVTVVILVPGMGDDIQTIKAGIMEIGDIFVINKADREGVERTRQEVEALLNIGGAEGGWIPSVVETIATQSEGIDLLADSIREFRESVLQSEARREQKLNFHRLRLVEMVRDRLLSQVVERVEEETLSDYAEKVLLRELDPYSAVDELVERVIR